MKVKIAFLLVLLFFLFIGVWIIKQKENLTYQGSAKTAAALIYLFPDLANIKKGETVIVDVIVDSKESSVLESTVEIPFDSQSLKLTKFSFTASPLTLSQTPFSVTDANKTGLIKISRALNTKSQKSATSQFLLVSLWFTAASSDKKIVELTPTLALTNIIDNLQKPLSPVEASGAVINILPALDSSVVPSVLPKAKPSISPNSIPVPILNSEDSYISAESTNENFGRSMTLKVSDEPENISYLKFDLKALAKKPVTLALLRLYNAERPVDSFRVSQASNNWSESKLNFLNKPPLGAEILRNDEQISGGWVDTDITEFVLENRGKVVSLRLDAPDGGELVFNSRENSSNQPYILVQ